MAGEGRERGWAGEGTGDAERAGMERVGQEGWEGWEREAVTVVEGVTGMAVEVKGRVEVAVKDWVVAKGLGRVAGMVAMVRVVVEGWVEEVARVQVDWVMATGVRVTGVWVAVHTPADWQAPPLSPCHWGWDHTPAHRVAREGQDHVLHRTNRPQKGWRRSGHM